jgi:hypothetical protein
MELLRRMDHDAHSASSASETTDTMTEQPKSSSHTLYSVKCSGLEPLLLKEEAIPTSVDKEMYNLSRSIQAQVNRIEFDWSEAEFDESEQ